MRQVFDFRTTPYFSGGILYLGISMVLPGLFITSINILASLPFFLISLIIATTHYRLEVDITNKTYRQYVWLMGLKWGEREPFETIEYMFVKRNKVSQTMNSMLNAREVHSEVYDGFLRFSEKDKVHLATTRTKVNLLKKLTPIANTLQVEILDYSDGTPTVIPTT